MTVVVTQMPVLQISKAFCEQHPEVRKAWVDDGIKDVAFQDAATRAWVVKPAWAAQPGILMSGWISAQIRVGMLL
jgi:hypothetical protein